MPSWFDIAPRFGVAYDLFGDARTALKASFNKYMAGQTLGFPARYNPLALRSETRTWTDTNRDDIAQDSEIGPKIDQKFGEATAIASSRSDDLQREHDLEYSVSVQHQVQVGRRPHSGLVPSQHLRDSADRQPACGPERLHGGSGVQPA